MFDHTSQCISFLLVEWFDQNPKWIQIVLKRDWKMGWEKQKDFSSPSFLLLARMASLFPTKGRPSLAHHLPHSPAGPASLSPCMDATCLLPWYAGPNQLAQGRSPTHEARPLPLSALCLTTWPRSFSHWHVGPTYWHCLPPRIVLKPDSSQGRKIPTTAKSLWSWLAHHAYALSNEALGAMP
jgi:hypothetical protein